MRLKYEKKIQKNQILDLNLDFKRISEIYVALDSFVAIFAVRRIKVLKVELDSMNYQIHFGAQYSKNVEKDCKTHSNTMTGSFILFKNKGVQWFSTMTKRLTSSPSQKDQSLLREKAYVDSFLYSENIS